MTLPRLRLFARLAREHHENLPQRPPVFPHQILYGFGDEDPTLIDEGYRVCKPLDLVDVVRRNQRRPVVFAGQLEERANQLVARERVEPAERLVEHDELWPVRQRHEPCRLHSHAAGERPHGKPAREIEIALKFAAQRLVPCWIDGRT